MKDPSTPSEADAQESITEAQRELINCHVHDYYRSGRMLVCDCGDTLGEGEI
jgi:hypothetical protein